MNHDNDISFPNNIKVEDKNKSNLVQDKNMKSTFNEDLLLNKNIDNNSNNSKDSIDINILNNDNKSGNKLIFEKIDFDEDNKIEKHKKDIEKADNNENEDEEYEDEDEEDYEYEDEEEEEEEDDDVDNNGEVNQDNIDNKVNELIDEKLKIFEYKNAYNNQKKLNNIEKSEIIIKSNNQKDKFEENTNKDNNLSTFDNKSNNTSQLTDNNNLLEFDNSKLAMITKETIFDEIKKLESIKSKDNKKDSIDQNNEIFDNITNTYLREVVAETEKNKMKLIEDEKISLYSDENENDINENNCYAITEEDDNELGFFNADKYLYDDKLNDKLVLKCNFKQNAKKTFYDKESSFILSNNFLDLLNFFKNPNINLEFKEENESINKAKKNDNKSNSKNNHISNMIIAMETYQNTNNTIIQKEQESKDKYEQKNINDIYNKRKATYITSMCQLIIKKFEDTNKRMLKASVSELMGAMEKIEKEINLLFKIVNDKSVNISKELNNIEITNDDFIAIMNYKSKALIEKFITNMYKEKVESEVTKIEYKIWKIKFCELINIWDLNNKVGLKNKIHYKYYFLKKFIVLKSIYNQNNVDLIKIEEEKKNLLSQLLGSQLDLIGLGKQKIQPYAKGLIKKTDINSILFEIIFAFCIIYSFITFPLLEYMDYKNTDVSNFKIFIYVIYYMKIVLNTRTVLINKLGEEIYDVYSILIEYLTSSIFINNILTSLPYEILFIYNKSVYSGISTFLDFLRLINVDNLTPVLNKLYQIKSISNYVKLVQLFVIFLFFAYYSACIMYSVLEKSINWSDELYYCYDNDYFKSRENVQFNCKFVILFYNGNYFNISQVPENIIGDTNLSPTFEYIFMVILFIVGQIISAYLFGGMAGVMRIMNEGNNLFTDKMDIIDGHMTFYKVNGQTKKDVKIYYDYIWQRHKDMVSGKSHFSLLTNSLRKQFEEYNLKGYELYLAKFINCGKESNMIVKILEDLKKKILFPYEILYEEGSVTKGLYILINGDIELTNKNIRSVTKQEYFIDFSEVKDKISQMSDDDSKASYNLDESNSIIFPLIPAFTKTGRNYQICYTKGFTDLMFLSLDKFEKLFIDFPVELHVLRHNAINEVNKTKLFDSSELFKVISQHSSRSVGKYFDDDFNKYSIWISIPIPISQRKIAKNYTKCFLSKVKRQSQEIILQGDFNINFYSNKIVQMVKSNNLNPIIIDVNYINNISNYEKLNLLTKNLSTLSLMYQQFSNSIDYCTESEETYSSNSNSEKSYSKSDETE